MKSFLKYNLFTIIWAGCILFLTLMPGYEMPATNIWDLFSFDKFAHAFVFAIFVFLMTIGCLKQSSFLKIKQNAISLSILIGIGYGILIEMIQLFIPERTVEFQDMVANTAGAGIGYGIFYIVYKS